MKCNFIVLSLSWLVYHGLGERVPPLGFWGTLLIGSGAFLAAAIDLYDPWKFTVKHPEVNR